MSGSQSPGPGKSKDVAQVSRTGEKSGGSVGPRLSPSAFAHLPDLEQRINDPQHSVFRELDFEAIDAAARENGMPDDWRRSHEEREANRHAVLVGRMSRDLWVFAYGSLMWDPGFYFDEVRVGRLEGYSRSFCLHLPTGRGTREHPGLMAALDTGGRCEGLVFRINADHVDRETEIIWRREMIAYGYVPAFVSVETAQGEVEALTFVANQDDERYLGHLEREEAAARIAHAEGILGSNLSYLENLHAQMEHLGLHDAKCASLLERAKALKAG